jgi:tetratricopeptide (TPR) repeat protein
VAVLAVEVTWPAINEGKVLPYEPWTVSRHWEQTVVEQVRGFGGVLLPHVPSLLVVAFGVPQALEQAPQRAVQAALALRRLVAETAERGPYPALRLAVHWGQVLVETGESDLPAGFLPIGETLVLPLRLLGQAAVGEILVSPVVGRLIAGWFELQARAGSQDTEGYLVVGLKSRPSPLRMHGQRPLSRFVGRERELTALEDLLEQAKAGRGQVVGLGGEPGVGKSRLLYEFRQPLTGRWITYLEGHCLSYGSTIPYLPVIDLLRQQFGITAADSPDAIITRVRICLQELGMDPDEGGAYLLQLLGVQAGIDRLATLSPEVIKARTFETLWQLYLGSSQQQPLVLAVENLHWTDQTSEDFMASLVEHLAGARIFLLLTYRPGYRPPWIGKSYVTQMVLPPLSSQDSLQMLQAILQTEQIPALAQMILAKAQGNPFFLEEIVQALIEQGVLAPAADGRVAVATPMPPKPLADMAIPPTVQEVLAARLDRLPPQEKGLLQMAAVIGTEVPWPLLQAITDMSDAALSRSLSQLQAAEFLYETSLFPERAYTFKHALTHEVAYGSLLQARRCALHARILEAIEALYPDRLAEHVEQLAHHAFQGEVWEKAVAYLQQAGVKADAHTAYHEAVTCFEQALVALQHLPEGCRMVEQAIDLRFDLRNALWSLGEFGRGVDYLCQAQTLAAGLDDQRRLGWVASYMADYFWRTGDPDRAIESGQRALVIAVTMGDFALQVVVNQLLGITYYGLGHYHQAIDILRRNVVILTGELVQERFGLPNFPSVHSRHWLVWGLAECGEFAEGIARGEEAIQIAEAIGQPMDLINACQCVGSIYFLKGDLQKAVPVLEHGLDLYQVANVPGSFPSLAAALGYAYALSGCVAESLHLLEQAVQKAVSSGRRAHLALWIAWLGEVYLLAGQREEAVRHALHARDLAHDHKEPGSQVQALWLLGEIAAQRDPPEIDQAEGYYRQALALAEEFGMRPRQAHCHLGLGTLYAKIGRPEPACAELSAALELYRAMDMTFWLTRAEAALAQVE